MQHNFISVFVVSRCSESILQSKLNVNEFMETMCTSDYHHSNFLTTSVLGTLDIKLCVEYMMDTYNFLQKAHLFK